MSRIGKMPITVPAGVEITVAEGNVVTVKGPKGTLTRAFHPNMKITVDGAVATVARPNDEKANKSLHGLSRTLLNNMVVGVTTGFKKELDVNGVGYRVQKDGKKLVMNLASPTPWWSRRPRTFSWKPPLPIRSLSPASTTRRLARWLQRSAASVPPSLTRARASSIPLRSFAARKARPAVRNN